MIVVNCIENVAGHSSAMIRIPGRDPWKLSVDHSWPAAKNANWIVPAMLPLAMSLEEDLKIEGKVTAELMANTAEIQVIYNAWLPRARRIEIAVDAEETGECPGPGGVGLFYSGGVDSLYSLVENFDRVTDLIAVLGFDIPSERAEEFARFCDGARETACHVGKSLSTVRTNIRQLSDEILGWGWYFGAALATVGMLSCHPACIIGSSYSYAQLRPWGSHPLLDTLWSTPGQKWIHHGTAATRYEKIRRLARDPWTLERLRVCWEDHASTNCGHCEKCLRTMVALLVAGAESPMLPAKVRPEEIRRLELRAGAPFWKEILEHPNLPEDVRAAVRAILRDSDKGIPPNNGTLRSRARRVKAYASHIFHLLS